MEIIALLLWDTKRVALQYRFFFLKEKIEKLEFEANKGSQKTC